MLSRNHLGLEWGDWGRFDGFGIIKEHADLFDAEVFGRCKDDEAPEKSWHGLNGVLKNSHLGEAIFIRSFDSRKMNLNEVWDESLDFHAEVLSRFRPGKPPIASKLTVQLLSAEEEGEPRSRFYIQSEGEQIYIAHITFYALFWVEKPKVLTPEASQYRQPDGRNISKSLQYTVSVGTKEMKVGLHKHETKPNQIVMTLETVRVDSKINPEKRSMPNKALICRGIQFANFTILIVSFLSRHLTRSNLLNILPSVLSNPAQISLQAV